MKLILLVLTAVLPLLILVIYAGMEERAHSLDHALQDALALARNIAASQDEVIDSAHHILFFVSQMVDEHEHGPETFKQMFARLSQHIPELTGMFVARADGEVIAHTFPLDTKLNISQRPVYQRLMQRKSFVIGEYQLIEATGTPILTLALPVLNNGEVKRIVVTGIDLRKLDRFINHQQLPAGADLTLLDDRGTVLHRYPRQDASIGKPLPETDLAKTIFNSAEGVARVTGPDGKNRLYGFASFGRPAGTMYVSVGIPSKSAFARADQATLRHLFWFIVVTILVLILAWQGSDIFIIRSLNRLLVTARLIGSGNLHARVGSPYGQGEIGQLTSAFDRMATALQQREEENKQTLAALSMSETRYRSLVMTSPDAVFLVAANFRIRMVNPQGVSLLGYDREEEVIGRHIRDFFPRKERAAAMESFKKTLALGGTRNLIRHILRKDGAISPVEINASVIAEEDDASLCVVAVIRDITDRRQKEQQIQLQLNRLMALRDIDMAITGSRDLRLTLKVILEQVAGQLAVDAAIVLLLDHHSLVLEFAAGHGFQTHALRHTRLKMGEGLAGRAAMERRTLAARIPAEGSYMEQSPLLARERFQTHIAVPLIAKGHVKGVLEIFHRTPLTPDQEWLDFLEALATQTAIAVDNAALFCDLERSNIDLVMAYDTTLEGWSRALDLRDKETEGHSRRVTEMTIRLARALAMPDAEIPHIRRGALLHDIGKMAIPDSILLKPGPLTGEEWEIMRQHPQYAYELLRSIDFLRLAIYIPYSHHEKWDGSGYPRGLKGETIPISARIFAVVDVWDALSSERPYRPAWPKEKVLAHISQEAGASFDPQIVEAFLKPLRP